MLNAGEVQTVLQEAIDWLQLRHQKEAEIENMPMNSHGA
jgi:hypothetical protein